MVFVLDCAINDVINTPILILTAFGPLDKLDIFQFSAKSIIHEGLNLLLYTLIKGINYHHILGC